MSDSVPDLERIRVALEEIRAEASRAALSSSDDKLAIYEAGLDKLLQEWPTAKRFEKRIIMMGMDARIACDGNCAKAWGINTRPIVEIKTKTGTTFNFQSDGEAGTAPADPGTYEDGDGKPLNAKSGEYMNKWCARECERCVMTNPGESDAKLILPDRSRRFGLGQL